MEETYYNLWEPFNERWTGSWRSGTFHAGYQNYHSPWPLTLSEVLQWLSEDWYSGINSSMSMIEANVYLAQQHSVLQVCECQPSPILIQERLRHYHALKFL